MAWSFFATFLVSSSGVFCSFAPLLSALIMEVSQKLKSVMMPVAMLAGVIMGITIPCVINMLCATIPYFVAVMLLIAYSKLHFRSIKISSMHVALFVIQMLGSLLTWKVLSYCNPLLAQQAFICLFCPVATSSPVIVGMLGGSLPCVVTYILLFYIGTSFMTPIMLPLVTGEQNVSFIVSSFAIAKQVMPMILLPLLIVLILKLKSKKTLVVLQRNQSFAFYLWSVTLVLVIGKAAIYVSAQPARMIPMEINLAIVSLLACLFQFGVGRIIGIYYKMPIAAAQSLGQKNVAISMWMIFCYMNPLLSVGMAAYSIFQNSINSLQLYFHTVKR